MEVRRDRRAHRRSGLADGHRWASVRCWDQIVGADLAAHTLPDGLTEGELVVVADSTAWATQVRLSAATLIRRLNAREVPRSASLYLRPEPRRHRQAGDGRCGQMLMQRDKRTQ